ncbi:recombinase family protein [Velocimicrobium porci]|uniref:Recombinase family protein n=1 Tax=Velocimicrobium porci TaxID=2606634 RepID=A0A6L5XZA7_9FIRM|nr:recombinase family protein [Velocimicrobium porci]MSS64180.1 recombinase family protein [Velocimicrobium porci]
MIYGYGRVSTKGKAKDGNSLEAQERLIKEHGAEVIYMDSFTGTKMTRPEFDKLLKELKAGDTLVVAKLDGFARSVSQASDLITKPIDEGIRVDVCNLGILDNCIDARVEVEKKQQKEIGKRREDRGTRHGNWKIIV